MNERDSAPGGLALVEALVNTLNVETGADTLDTAAGCAALAIAGPDVPAARTLREALRAVCLAHAGHRPPEGASASLLDALLADAPLRVAVDADGAASLRPVEEPPGLTARVAVAVAAASADGTWARLKVCEAADCRWAYYDRSPAGRRRWCSMSVCGARAKMRTYRAKRG
ncbi:CGNR zinc finger domain-containing protein [Streptomyces poriferorum]|uniref:CGNR zinc finger domain-containing protein n=1 Tax=Streptomyces poriferorum TaxID=2798799 RepID=A0ABY9ITM1_9ACTN|nr:MULTISPECIES: CGNR zinc finger domain-containing protein [unclassified Streptomyces]MDP5312351.1 CGNR zinc finger domain-containing protein [Streptomyces sp. Alt4]WLQ48717.1 CGNR zinc finger domain-containing protein [Streptomyces sp. Alt1]WLQ58605.1 CGNR zinc finger domain-containing protein [Streptomyces sp. Alt2]